MVTKTATLPLAHQTLAKRNRVTAAEVEAGLPSGTYSIIKAEVDLLGAPLVSGSGFITSFQDSANFQVQEFRNMYLPRVWRRYKDTATWGKWVYMGDDDTGWRNVSSELHADATGTLLVRRQGPRVTARFYTAVTVSQTFMRLFSLPVGWRPRTRSPLGVAPYGNLGQVLAILVVGDTWRLEAHRESLLNLTDYLQGELTWLTDDQWPTTLPGTPA